MLEVAIIGAGELGGALAHRLAARDLARAIRLIDERGAVAAGKALDIMQAGPIEGFATRVAGSGDVTDALGAALIVVADRAGGGEWSGEEALALLSRIAGAGSLIVCAGASQREIVEHAVRELRVARRRIVGSAPEALASAARAMVALETNCSVRDISLTVLGVPPAHIVVPWESAAIGGLAAAAMVDVPMRRRLDARIARLWPPGPPALAAAACKAIEAVTGRSRQLVSCFVGPDDASGRRTRAVALPAQLGAEGLQHADAPALTTHDRVALDTAMLL